MSLYSKFLEKSTKMSQNILYYRKALQVGLHISKDFVIFPKKQLLTRWYVERL